jgi:hypothetical protein
VANLDTAFKIRCASQAPNCTDIGFLTASNRLYVADMNSQAVGLLQDLSSLRGRLDPKDEMAAMAMPMEGLTHVVWKDGSHFWLAELGRGRVGDKVDLRYLIDKAGWMDEV